MNVSKNKIIELTKYTILSIILNLVFVIIHEMGHAIIYSLQGYKIAFHFTEADPVSGARTLLGASGGLLFNLIFAAVFLFLLLRYKNIYLFAGVVANTLFARIILDVIKLPKGMSPGDETAIGNLLNINPMIVSVLIFIIFILMLIYAVKILYTKYDTSYVKFILVLSFIACIISLFVVIPFDTK